MNYGDVALGVECALPQAALSQAALSMRRDRMRRFVNWLSWLMAALGRPA